MSNFFNIKTKTVVCMLVFLILYYTMINSFSIVSAGDFAPKDPATVGFGMTRTKVVNDSDVTEIESANSAGWWTAAFGAIVGVILCVSIVGAPFGAAVLFTSLGSAVIAGAVIGAGTGYAAGFVFGYVTDALDITFFFDDFLNNIRSFFGGIFDLMAFCLDFATFGNVVGTLADKYDVPSWFNWLLFLVVIPIWFTFTLWLAGIGLEFAKGGWSFFRAI